MTETRTRMRWTTVELDLLFRLASDPKLPWVVIAQSFPGRSANQCASRYYKRGGKVHRTAGSQGLARRFHSRARRQDVAECCIALRMRPAPEPATITAAVFGDPLPGRSALDQRNNMRGTR